MNASTNSKEIGIDHGKSRVVPENAGSSFAHKAREANAEKTFQERLQELVQKNFEGSELRKLSLEDISSQVESVKRAEPAASLRTDPLGELASLGKYVEATFANVGAFTGDVYMLRSALNVYRVQKPEELEPVHEVQSETGKNS